MLTGWPTPACRGAAPPRCHLQPCWPLWRSPVQRFLPPHRTHSSSGLLSILQDASVCKETQPTSVPWQTHMTINPQEKFKTEIFFSNKMFSFSWPTENTKYIFNYHIIVKTSFSQDNLTVPHQKKKKNRSRGLMGASRRCKQTGN